jgi:AcrR family transcriptional regulator
MRRARTPVRAPLTRERIARAALQLIDAEGLEACSMRRLGSSLGVEAMALYHHFPAKGQLLDAVMDLLVDEMEMPARGTEPPLARLRRCIGSYRRIAIRHPRAFLLLAARRFNTERAFAMYEQILEAFADAGLNPAESARWFRLIGGFASGAGMAEVASRERTPDATPLQLEHAPERIAHPHVRAVAPHLRIQNLDAVFEFGLNLLFDALAERVATGKSGRGRTRKPSPRAKS